MTPIDTLDTIQAEAQRIIALVGPADRSRSTPCEGWDVAMLLDKMVTSASLFSVLCRGETPVDLNLLFPGPIGRDNPNESFASAATECRAAFVASKLEGEMMGPLGVMVPRRAASTCA